MALLTVDSFDLDKTSTSIERRYPGSTGFPATLPDVAGRLGGKCHRASEPATHIFKIDHPDLIPAAAQSVIYNFGIALRISQPSGFFETDFLTITGYNSINYPNRLKVSGDSSNTEGFNLELNGIYNLNESRGVYLKYDEWHYIELEQDIGDSDLNRRASLYVNDERIYHTEDYPGSTSVGITQSRLELDCSGNNIDIDDLYIYVDSPFGRLGSRTSVASMHPNGLVEAGWTPTGETENYLAVDDSITGQVDDDITYVASEISLSRDKHEMTEPEILDSSVFGFEYAIDAKTEESSLGTVEPIIDIDGEVVSSVVDINPASLGYGRSTQLFEKDPYSNEAITVEKLSGMQAGYKLPTGSSGSGNYILEITKSDASTANTYLDSADDLRIRFGSIYKKVSQSGGSIPVTWDGGSGTIPLVLDTENTLVSFRLSDPTRYDGITPTNPGVYRQITVKDKDILGAVNHRIYIDFEHPLPQAVTIAYDVSGTGVTDSYPGAPIPIYSIDSGASPITVDAGESSTYIEVDADFGTDLSAREYSLIFKINPGASSGIRTAEESDEFRLYIAPKLELHDPLNTTERKSWGYPAIYPQSQNDISISSTGIHSAGVVVETNDLVTWVYNDWRWGSPIEPTLYWKVSDNPGGLVEGTDWYFCDSLGNEISQGDAGSIDRIAYSNLKVYIKFINYTAGDTLTIDLDYERIEVEQAAAFPLNTFNVTKRLDVNKRTQTSSWDMPENISIADMYWPDEFDSGDLVTNHTAFTERTVLNVADSTKKDSEGEFLRVLYLNPDYSDTTKNPDPDSAIPYMRKNFAGEYSTDGSIEYVRLERYNIFTIKVCDPSANMPDSSYSPAEYIKITLRERGISTDEGGADYVLPDGDSNAEAIFRRTGANTWTLDSTSSTTTNNGVNLPFVHAGVVVDSSDGSSRLWVIRDDSPSQARMDHGGFTVLIRPIFGPSGDVFDTTDNLLSKSIILYEPMTQTSEDISLLNNAQSGTLPRFWPRKRNQWEPRGNATIVTNQGIRNYFKFNLQ